MKTQGGFTLLEMSLVLLVMAAIAIPATEGIKQQVRKLKLERGAREMVAIQEAGLRYYQDNGSWPANITTLVNTNYLPAGSTVSPWGSAYTTSASGNNFTVSVNTDANAQATRLQSRLPFTSTTNRTVRSTVGIPGTETAHLALTPRDGSRAWTGSHNAGGNSLTNMNTASAVRVNASNEVTASNRMRSPRFEDSNNTAFAIDPASTSTVNRIDATSQMRAPIVYDSNNTGYYSDPSGTSRFYHLQALNQLRTPLIYDQDDTSYYLNPNGTSNVRHLFATNQVRANIFYDLNNTAYYMQPRAVSIMNDVRASIFYDRNNTNYYVNPNSVTNLNRLFVGGQEIKKTRISGTYTCVLSSGSTRSCGIGASATHDVCYLTYTRAYDGDDMDGFYCRVYRSGSSWFITNWGKDFDVVQCSAQCLKF